MIKINTYKNIKGGTLMVINRKRQVAFLSTYPPRECGLATFTQDLTNELDKIKLLNESKIISISIENHTYDKKVIFDIKQDELDTYLAAAKVINESKIDLLCIQHEYGIFGGNYGDYLIDLIDKIEIPIVTTLHTVVPQPNIHQKYIINKLSEKSSKIITMARNTIDILKNVYGLEGKNIQVIPHGVPYKILPPREKLKIKYGYKDKIIISTFGLISPGKGLEYGIEAVSKIIKDFKNVIYLILGQTHPVVKKHYGEVYRQKLQNMVNELGLSQHVKFIDKYLEKDELLEYLKLTDIYMTPYIGKDQAVSGTLAYAVGYGKAIVSTPYLYAQELLENGRGLLADFKDADSLAECLSTILENPQLQKQLETRTKAYGRSMIWKNVATAYAKTFIDIIENKMPLEEVI